MNDQPKLIKAIKSAAGLSFAVAFIMAINLFGEIGRSILSKETARIIFISAGGIGLVLNLISFQTGRFNPVYNLIYWLGSIVVFIGLVAILMNWPYARVILIAGMLSVGVSFFLPKSLTEKKSENSDLLDN